MTMSEAVPCPSCQRLVAAGADRCVFCGAPMNVSAPGKKTTGKVFPKGLSPEEKAALCKKTLPNLTENMLALFAQNYDDPIQIPNVQTKFLGRLQRGVDPSLIDLTPYGADNQGVSRFHARITFEKGYFKIEDLVSTNGTWLNAERLAPGKLYDLHCTDTILLSNLPLVVCYHEGVLSKTIEFDVKRIPSLVTVRLQILTPYFLETALSKYLAAIVEIYHVCQLSSGKQIEDAYIHSIRCAELAPIMHIQMDAVGEAVELIRKWVMPWRRSHANQPMPKAWSADSRLQPELAKLAQELLQEAAPEVSEEALNPFVERIAVPVFILATSELELT